MKKYTNIELKEILENLKNGSVYIGIYNNCGNDKITYHNNFINYSYFGSSAVKANIKNLRWLLENIFSECEKITEAVYSEYHINYIPIDKKYNAVDLSRNHPNVYGL